MNASIRDFRSPPVYLWVLILGAAGFAAGFFGPMVLVPGANQGPLVGILITGPGGAMLGLLLFVVCRLLRLAAALQWKLLLGTSAALALATLYFILPKPALRGNLIEGEVQKCGTPADAQDAAFQYWDRRIAQVTWAPPRPGWKEDARARLQTDRGVVLDVVVARENGIYERQKPWNKGQVVAMGWQAANDPKSYYAPGDGGSCADYPAGTKIERFIPYNLSGLTRGAADWPPREIADFLNRQTLEPVPENLRQFAGE